MPRGVLFLFLFLSLLLVFLGSGFWNKVCFWFIRLGGVLIFARPPWTQHFGGPYGDRKPGFEGAPQSLVFGKLYYSVVTNW